FLFSFVSRAQDSLFSSQYFESNLKSSLEFNHEKSGHFRYGLFQLHGGSRVCVRPRNASILRSLWRLGNPRRYYRLSSNATDRDDRHAVWQLLSSNLSRPCLSFSHVEGLSSLYWLHRYTYAILHCFRHAGRGGSESHPTVWHAIMVRFWSDGGGSHCLRLLQR